MDVDHRGAVPCYQSNFLHRKVNFISKVAMPICRYRKHQLYFAFLETLKVRHTSPFLAVRLFFHFNPTFVYVIMPHLGFAFKKAITIFTPHFFLGVTARWGLGCRAGKCRHRLPVRCQAKCCLSFRSLWRYISVPKQKKKGKGYLR